jgi:hypothetical protein
MVYKIITTGNFITQPIVELPELVVYHQPRKQDNHRQFVDGDNNIWKIEKN